MRTSKIAIFIRATVIVFVVYMVMATLWNSITNTNFWSVTEMAISAVLTVLLFGGFAWAVTNVGMALMYGRSQQYHAYRQGGGDPYFDSLPSPLNPDSRQVRETGMAEPRTPFVPPASWKFQCPVCGAVVSNIGLMSVGTATMEQMEIAANIFRSLASQSQMKSVNRNGPISGAATMSDLNEVIEQLWLYNTFEEDPWTVDRAFAAICDDGEVAIEGLLWALKQEDLGLKLLALRLLREFGPEAKRALPAVVRCFADEDRLVRVTAVETVRQVHWRLRLLAGFS